MTKLDSWNWLWNLFVSGRVTDVTAQRLAMVRLQEIKPEEVPDNSKELQEAADAIDSLTEEVETLKRENKDLVKERGTLKAQITRMKKKLDKND